MLPCAAVTDSPIVICPISVLMDKSFFTKVDIREFTELEIPSKSPKLIFSAPKKSYKLQKGKEGSLLTIIDPEEFWKNSRYLVIQL